MSPKAWRAVVHRRSISIYKSKVFKKKFDAERWARDIERQIDAGNFVDRSAAEDTTLAEAMERYLDEIIVAFDDIGVYREFLYGRISGDFLKQITGDLLQKMPSEVIPVVTDAIAGNVFKGRKVTNSARHTISKLVVNIQEQLDKDAKQKVRKAIKKFEAEAPIRYKKELGRLLKELE